MEIVEMKEMSRAEIQEKLKPLLKEFFEGLGAQPDAALVRRGSRALMHEAAKMILDNGGDVGLFAYSVQAAWAKEQSPESLGEACLVIPSEAESN